MSSDSFSADEDETISVDIMESLFRELEDRSSMDAAISLADILSEYSLSPENIELLRELAAHHFRIVKQREPDLSIREYMERFPDHTDLIEDPDDPMMSMRVNAALMALSQLKEEKESMLTGARKDDVVGDFRNGPLALLQLTMQKALRAKMQPHAYDDESIIIQEGDEGDQLFICCRGAANVSITQADGKTLLIGRIVPGQVFGEMALMGIARRTATVIADGPVDVLTLSKQDFQTLLDQHQEFSDVITMIISERLGNQKRDALSSVSLEGYSISKMLGRGGMAVVYDARHEETQQRVALKMMSHRLAVDDQARDWFYREADLIASFDHPHIPRLHERFDAFATSFMAIEFVEGASLDEVCKEQGPFDEDSALCIISHVAQALHYAHAAEIVHRDVKPSNCMVDKTGSVKLMDFGLSIPVFSGGTSGTVVVGTPAYMSPEQLRGEIRPESDWFSLGCLAYELITGERLLNPRNLLSMYRRFEDWDVEKIVGHLPVGKRSIRKYVRSLLSIEPEDRLEFVDELKTDQGVLKIGDWNCLK